MKGQKRSFTVSEWWKDNDDEAHDNDSEMIGQMHYQAWKTPRRDPSRDESKYK